MKDKYGYIYITKNLINGKIYIGQHKSISYDSTYYGSGKYFLRSYKKYGRDCFSNTILSWCDSPEQMNELEKFYIWLYSSTNNDIGYNITNGGVFGDTFTNLTEDDKKVRVKKISESLEPVNMKHSKEWKMKMSYRMSGENNPQFGRIGTNTGKKFSKEHVQKIADANRGRKASPYQIKKLSESHQGQRPSDENLKKLAESNKKAVNVFKDGKLIGCYSSANECYESFVKINNIGKRKFFAKLRHNINCYDTTKSYVTYSKDGIDRLKELDRFDFKYKDNTEITK